MSSRRPRCTAGGAFGGNGTESLNKIIYSYMIVVQGKKKSKLKNISFYPNNRLPSEPKTSVFHIAKYKNMKYKTKDKDDLWVITVVCKSWNPQHTYTSGRQLKIKFFDVLLDYSDYSILESWFSLLKQLFLWESKNKTILPMNRTCFFRSFSSIYDTFHLV